jgi:hypothetical protein
VSRLSRLANVFRSSAVDRALDDEMQFHIDARVDDLVASGMTREAAESAASRQFGNRLRARESSRDLKLLPWVESVFKDIRFALRMFRKHIVVTGAAIASLTLVRALELSSVWQADSICPGSSRRSCTRCTRPTRPGRPDRQDPVPGHFVQAVGYLNSRGVDNARRPRLSRKPWSRNTFLFPARQAVVAMAQQESTVTNHTGKKCRVSMTTLIRLARSSAP